jgi:hypothetical protein
VRESGFPCEEHEKYFQEFLEARLNSTPKSRFCDIKNAIMKNPRLTPTEAAKHLGSSRAAVHLVNKNGKLGATWAKTPPPGGLRL